MDKINISISACALDGCGNSYMIVAREVGANGPWWITPIDACRHLPSGEPYYGGACEPYERATDRAAVADAVREAMIAATSDRPPQGLRYALAMAFPTYRPMLGDWRNDDPLVIPYTSDGDTPQRRVYERLVRTGRARTLGPVWDDAREAVLLAWSSRAHGALIALMAACDAVVFGDGTVEHIRQARAERIAALAAPLGEYESFRPRGGDADGLWLADALTGAELVEDLRRVLCGHYGWLHEESIVAFIQRHSMSQVRQ